MHEGRRAGSVLVTDNQQRLIVIFTGRDAVRTLAEGEHAAVTTLAQAMTPNPVTITPENRAIDALRKMSDGGFLATTCFTASGMWVRHNSVLDTRVHGSSL